MYIVHILICLALTWLMRAIVGSFRKGKGGGASSGQSASSGQGASAGALCSQCGNLMRSPSARTKGIYGTPFRCCSKCGKEHYDCFYHELALATLPKEKNAYPYESGTYEKELEASRRRLEQVDYPARLYALIDRSDVKSKAALKAVIQPHMQRYVDLLHKRVGDPYPPFRMAIPSLLTTLSYEARNPGAVQTAMEKILLHYGLNPKIFHVIVTYDDSATGVTEGVRGTYSHGAYSGGTINVILDRTHSEYDTVVAILLHECAHAFLRTRGITLPESQDAERLTDAAVIYLGGGDYLLRGYYPNSVQCVGYLKEVESEICLELVNRLAASVKAKNATEEKQLLNAWSIQEKRIRALKESIEQNKQKLHPAKVFRAESIQLQFHQQWQDGEACLTETGNLLAKIKDGAGIPPAALRNAIEQASNLEKRLSAFSGTLREWCSAESWQASQGAAALSTVRGVQALVENNNAFAILERIKFWARCPYTCRDAEIYFRKLQMVESADHYCAIGICYMQGLGVSKNEVTARQYLSKAASMGSRDAIRLLEKK